MTDVPTPCAILDDRLPGAAHINAVEDAIVSRRSIRAFLPTPVPEDTIRRILAVAARAPSGTNTQPWKVYVLTGDAKQRLCERVVAAYDDPAQDASHREEYDYYPVEWKSPYIDRRRKVGWDLYGLLGIGRHDKARMHAQHARNFRFFDAPVGFMFTIDRIMPRGSWLDYGGFLEAIMVAARGHGLHTCPQQAWARFHRIVMPLIGAAAHEQLVCGMALGHADWGRIENTLVTERERVDGFVRFVRTATEVAA
jgi:nitroreductase